MRLGEDRHDPQATEIKQRKTEAAPGQKVAALVSGPELPVTACPPVRVHRLWLLGLCTQGGSQDGPRSLTDKSSLSRVPTLPAPGQQTRARSLCQTPRVTGAAPAGAPGQ